jgi:uncharacterized protein YnzC (UPF0291/DUF896 family)
MEKAKIDRINALAAKAKTPEGLTDAEKAEQKALREEYLTEYRRALRGQLNETVILRPDGTKEVLKKK